MSLLVQCQKCRGEAFVALHDGLPWSHYQGQQRAKDGYVQPVPCQRCKQTGVLVQPDHGTSYPIPGWKTKPIPPL